MKGEGKKYDDVTHVRELQHVKTVCGCPQPLKHTHTHTHRQRSESAPISRRTALERTGALALSCVGFCTLADYADMKSGMADEELIFLHLPLCITRNPPSNPSLPPPQTPSTHSSLSFSITKPPHFKTPLPLPPPPPLPPGAFTPSPRASLDTGVSDCTCSYKPGAGGSVMEEGLLPHFTTPPLSRGLQRCWES